jgi:hypothetical protein
MQIDSVVRLFPQLQADRPYYIHFGTAANGCSGAIPLKKCWFEVIGWRGPGRGHAGQRRVASGRCGRRRHRDQLGELAEVLGSGGEVEFVASTVRSS